MNWQLVLTSALISGIVSSIIALYANERIKKVEFNFDFKKHVLQKRIATYEMIENLINEFIDDGFQEHFKKWFFVRSENNEQIITGYLKNIHRISSKNMWLSQPIIFELTQLSLILGELLKENEVATELPFNVSVERQEQSYKFFTHLADLQKHYFLDVSRMNNVDAFMKMKNEHMVSIVNNLSIVIGGFRQESISIRNS
jgi:hypothetical protein